MWDWQRRWAHKKLNQKCYIRQEFRASVGPWLSQQSNLTCFCILSVTSLCVLSLFLHLFSLMVEVEVVIGQSFGQNKRHRLQAPQLSSHVNLLSPCNLYWAFPFMALASWWRWRWASASPLGETKDLGSKHHKHAHVNLLSLCDLCWAFPFIYLLHGGGGGGHQPVLWAKQKT